MAAGNVQCFDRRMGPKGEGSPDDRRGKKETGSMLLLHNA